MINWSKNMANDQFEPNIEIASAQRDEAVGQPTDKPVPRLSETLGGAILLTETDGSRLILRLSKWD